MLGSNFDGQLLKGYTVIFIGYVWFWKKNFIKKKKYLSLINKKNYIISK